MELNLINCDAYEYMKNRLENDKFDAIITDPEYDDNGVNIAELRRICNGNIVAFCKPEHEFFKPDERAYWIKTPSTKNTPRKLARFVEHIIISRGPTLETSTFNNLHWSRMTGVYHDQLVTKQEHPWEKPLSLIETLLLIYTNRGDTVFDPFCGSGVVGVACAKHGRNFIGIERNPEYYALARRNIFADNYIENDIYCAFKE